MLSTDKTNAALYALQGILVRARQMARERADHAKLEDLLDAAHELPHLIASKNEETERFRRWIAEIGERHKCRFVVQYFDEGPPKEW